MWKLKKLRRQRVNAANDETKLIDDCETFQKDDLKFKISCEVNADDELRKWCIDAVETNMKNYDTSQLESKDKEKQNDMNEKWARFLIARDESNEEIAGFAMFRFDIDFQEAVLYW